MKKVIEIVSYEYDGLVEIEWINNEAYTICQIPLYSLGLTDKEIEGKVYREGEIKDLEWEYDINWKKLLIKRKKLQINFINN